MELLQKMYFGKIVKQKLTQNFYLTLTSYESNSRIPNHRHENPYVSLNLGSVYGEQSGAQNYEINKGVIITRPSHYEHENNFSRTRGLCFNIEMIGKTFIENFSKNEFNTAKKGKNIFHNTLTAFVNDYNHDEILLAVEENINSLFSNKSKDINERFGKPQWFDKVVEYLNEEYSNQISLDLLAGIASVHPNYLTQKFKIIQGSTLTEYLRKIRIEKAYDLLLKNEFSLTEIATMTGFYDQSHFIKTFKKYHNCSPNKIRLAIRSLI